MLPPVPRRLLVAAAAIGVAAALAGCSMDEAELLGPDTDRISAEPDQLRVLTYPDDPRDGWIDVVVPDERVFREGDEFREQDSRTADDDEPAERRRLLTAVEPGRTLLVELNCPGCAGAPPTGPSEVTDLHVWDLVVGDGDGWFSAGTAIARAGETHDVSVGDYLVVVRPGDEAPATPEVSGKDPVPLRLVASHAPGAGADLHVDVFVAVGAGDATIAYDTGDAPTEYRVDVR